MSLIKKVLDFIRVQLAEVPATGGEYTKGYRDMGEQTQQYIEELMWEEGIEDEET